MFVCSKGGSVEKRTGDAKVGASHLPVRDEAQTGQLGARESRTAQYKSLIKC